MLKAYKEETGKDMDINNIEKIEAKELARLIIKKKDWEMIIKNKEKYLHNLNKLKL